MSVHVVGDYVNANTSLYQFVHEKGLHRRVGHASAAVSARQSGSVSFAMMSLPAGAQVVGLKYLQNNNAYNMVSHSLPEGLMSIAARIGNVIDTNYMLTASGTVTYEMGFHGSGRPPQSAWSRILSASANLVLWFQDAGNAPGTATNSTLFSVIVDFYRMERGD